MVFLPLPSSDFQANTEQDPKPFYVLVDPYMIQAPTLPLYQLSDFISSSFLLLSPAPRLQPHWPSYYFSNMASYSCLRAFALAVSLPKKHPYSTPIIPLLKYHFKTVFLTIISKIIQSPHLLSPLFSTLSPAFIFFIMTNNHPISYIYSYVYLFLLLPITSH